MYVFLLDEYDDDELRVQLKKLRADLGDVELEVSTLDWASLAGSFDSLPGVLKASTPYDRQVTGKPASGALALYDEAFAASASYLSFDAFQQEGVECIRQRGDDELTEATEKLLSTVGKDPLRRAAADYYSRFLPGTAAMAAEQPGILRRIISAVTEAIVKIVKAFGNGLSEVWTVLQDPDAYYLRLRGELAEWADRRAPDAAWLRWVMLAPDLFRLYVRLLLDERVSRSAKLKLLGALAYIVLPYDLVPEALLGPVGFVDDVYVASVLIAEMTRGHWVPRGLLEEHWAGPTDTLDFVMHISDSVGEVGVPFLEHVWSWLRTQLGWDSGAAGA